MLTVLILLSLPALAHSSENYAGHDTSLCKPANALATGALACSDPAANPCYSGQHCELNDSDDTVCHGHSAYPPGKNDTPACQAYRNRPTDPPQDDPPSEACVCCDRTQLGTSTTPWLPGECEEACDEWVRDIDPRPASCPVPGACHEGQTHCDHWGDHGAHDCSVCDDRDGTCGWTNNHRHPFECPDRIVDPPEVDGNTKECECCTGDIIDIPAADDCQASCDQLIRQMPHLQCPEDEDDPDPPPEVPDVPDPPEDDPPVVTPNECECCPDVVVTAISGEDCATTCDSLKRQMPQACPVEDDPPPKEDDPPAKDDPPKKDDPPPKQDDPPPDECECCEGVEVDRVAGWTCDLTCDSLKRAQPHACPVVEPEPEPEPEPEAEDEPETEDRPKIEACLCCEDVLVDRADGWTCAQTCASLTKQIPDACPVAEGNTGGGGGTTPSKSPPSKPPPSVPPRTVRTGDLDLDGVIVVPVELPEEADRERGVPILPPSSSWRHIEE